MTEQRIIRVGVLGVGHLGFHHARLYHELPGAELAGIYDPRDKRAEEVAGQLNCVAFPSAEALLDAELDAVSIAAPTTLHFELTKQALKAGLDVLVEKPMATNSVQAHQMIEYAEANERILQVGHVERFNGAVIALRSAIKKPRFIECHRLSPYPRRGHDVSVVLDLMIHDLDIVLALDPSAVVGVDAIGVPVFSESEDIANARVRFASGCVANLTSSRVSVEQMRKIRIFEENAYVSTNYSEQEVLIYRKKPGPIPQDASPMDFITIEPLEVQREEPLRLELAAFLESVRTRKRPEVAGAEGLRALELAEQVIAFMREHA